MSHESIEIEVEEVRYFGAIIRLVILALVNDFRKPMAFVYR